MAIPYSRTIAGGLPWYSALIVAGIAVAIWLAERERKRLSLPEDTVVDLALVVVPAGIVGARMYYVAMSWPSFAQDPWSVFRIWEGGIAIYGAVIGGAIGALAYARKKHLSFSALADIIMPGLLLAQAIGRWGNYFNMEAYGPLVTDARLQFFPVCVLIPSASGYEWHAATFFYESVWNLCGFAALWGMRKKMPHRGMLTAWYFVIYGSGRFIIEQLRQDSLYLGPLRVSQYLSLVLCVGAGLFLLWHTWKRQMGKITAAGVCLGLWILRWALLDQTPAYAVVTLLAGMLSMWLLRKNRRALGWLCAAIVLDAAGILLNLLHQPLSAEVSMQLHALLCSLTLPLATKALTCKGGL